MQRDPSEKHLEDGAGRVKRARKASRVIIGKPNKKLKIKVFINSWCHFVNCAEEVDPFLIFWYFIQPLEGSVEVVDGGFSSSPIGWRSNPESSDANRLILPVNKSHLSRQHVNITNVMNEVLQHRRLTLTSSSVMKVEVDV